MEVGVVVVSLGNEDSHVSIKKLTVGGQNNTFPYPSPDGKWLVFRSGRSGHKNLYIMDAEDGRPTAQKSRNPCRKDRPPSRR
jgi:Tol biopolymer transport system component